jgi:site-specific DNA-methyltransferase (adenine-specific)
VSDPQIYAGDMREVLPGIVEWGTRVDAVVTDPPYHLASIVKRFGAAGSAPAKGGHKYERLSRGFMGKNWDGGDVAFRPETWATVGTVMKPGAHLVAFGGTKGWHRMACAIEDAGFEIRDSLAWLYGTGFPKTRNDLKPAFEPIVLARWPLAEKTRKANIEAHGTGGLQIEAARGSVREKPKTSDPRRVASSVGFSPSPGGNVLPPERWPASIVHDGSADVLEAFPDLPGGNASRIFYCAKAGASERLDAAHPTIKPLALMRWLVRLITPAGGTVLDPFAGTGTTGHACMAEGFGSILCELEAESLEAIHHRVDHVHGRDLPLFEGLDYLGPR